MSLTSTQKGLVALVLLTIIGLLTAFYKQLTAAPEAPITVIAPVVTWEAPEAPAVPAEDTLVTTEMETTDALPAVTEPTK